MRRLMAAVVVAVLVVGAAVILAKGVRPTTVAPPTASLPAMPSASIAAVPTLTPMPVLRADAMATIAAPGDVRVWTLPGGTKAKALSPALPAGAVVFLTRGPRRVDAVDWWEVQADHRPGLPVLFGWVHATDGADRPTLLPFASSCPPADAPIDEARLVAIGDLQALACFGGREIAVRGDLACYDAAVDRIVGGASWLGFNYSCAMNSVFYMEGPVVAGLNGGRRPVTGFYEARGHFDDPESAACSFIPFGTSLTTPSGHPDPGAVISCRQVFVVTSTTKLP